MAAFSKFSDFVVQLGKGNHDLDVDTLKVFLTNQAPTSGDALKSDITEIAGGSGYTAGGEDVSNAYSGAGGVGSCVGTDVVWTASGGSIGPFRYAVLYNSSVGDLLIGYWDYGSTLTLANGETFTLDFGSSIFTIT